MSAPAVTVVISCRDQGGVLEGALDSVFAQTHAPLQILVVDDGSLDERTRGLLDRLEWPHTTVLRHDHPSRAAARRLGLEHARGEFICLMDAPHALRPRFLERATAALAGGNAAFVTSGFEAAALDVRAPACTVPLLLAGWIHPTAVARASVVRAAGFPCDDLPDVDLDLWLRLLRSGAGGLVLPEVLLDHGVPAGLVAPGSLLPVAVGLLEPERSSLEPTLALEVLSLREQLWRDLWLVRSHTGDRPGPSAPMGNEELESALADAQRRVEDLTSSLSWQLTSPLRWVHRALFGGRR